MMRKLAIIADDLTGAMDSGVQLSKMGYTCRTVIDKKRVKEILEETDAAIFNTETRNVSPEISARQLEAVMKTVRKYGLELVYKKIDSTLRGNIGRELETILLHSEKELVIVSPALPRSGRTTKNGYHFINNVILTDTEMAEDYFSPIRQACIPDLIRAQTKIKTGVIGLREIEAGEKNVAVQIETLYSLGYGIIVADAVKTDHLKIIADAVARTNINILLCGSAGLIEKSDNFIRKVFQEGKDDFVVVVSGSPSETTDIQIKESRKNKSIKTIILNTDNIFSARKRNSEITRIENKIRSAVTNHKAIIIGVPGERKSGKIRQSKNGEDTFGENSTALGNTLAELFLFILRLRRPCGAVIVGGDTVLSLCKAVGAHSMAIQKEIEPYVPLGLLKGGSFTNMPVVTKAGGLGTPTSIVDAIEYLQKEC
ncbi:MAG: four-carbon acid sugar kinase family protein [Victivallaceae bacterium]|nr:four-carbon acid sugar kinase family protein [Victivallaceae bacterium]